MRVAVISAEAVPYSKTGGLGDVAGALPKALKNIGIDSVLVTPCYWQTDGRYLWETAVADLEVEWRGGLYQAKAFYSEANGSPTFLIDAPSFFHRDSIYGYQEDYERFAFFNRAALCLLRRIGPPPDIVHFNDWHCGFGVVELPMLRSSDDYWRETRTVFSVHNMAYRGEFAPGELWKIGFGYDFAFNAFSFDGYASALKAGLETADVLSTVSRRYAMEIQTPEFGNGLDWLTRRRSKRLIGITNGIDFESWNPETDTSIAANFSKDDISGKFVCKRALLEQFSLPVDVERPIFASISRLTPQKGFELIHQAAGDILATGAYFIALGSGEKRYEEFLQGLRDYAPEQVGVYIGYNEEIAHSIEAGADIFLMPSLFEPCGLNQMYSLRYGTVPVVRAVGGLDDTVQTFDAINRTGNGFKFAAYDAERFVERIYEALYAFTEPETWAQIQRNGMSVDNSWTHAARNYVSLYEWTSAGCPA